MKLPCEIWNIYNLWPGFSKFYKFSPDFLTVWEINPPHCELIWVKTNQRLPSSWPPLPFHWVLEGSSFIKGPIKFDRLDYPWTPFFLKILSLKVRKLSYVVFLSTSMKKWSIVNLLLCNGTILLVRLNALG